MADDGTLALPMKVEEITPDWLETALRSADHDVQVAGLDIDEVQPGTASKILLKATYAAQPGTGGPPSALCVKGGFDPSLLELAAGRLYRREADFFRHVAPGLSVGLPRCWFAGGNVDQDQGIVILDDLRATGCTFGDVLQPATPDLVAQSLPILATLHAGSWGAGPARYPWLDEFTPIRAVADVMFDAQYWDGHFGSPDAPPVPADLLDRERTTRAIRVLWASNDRAPQALSHGDPHLGNTYVDADGRPGFLDWQGLCAAPPIDDVAYFITGALTVEDRRTHEQDLLRTYLGALRSHSDVCPTFDQAWHDYRANQLHGFFWALTGARMQRRDRVRAMSERHLTGILDHDAIELVLAETR